MYHDQLRPSKFIKSLYLSDNVGLLLHLVITASFPLSFYTLHLILQNQSEESFFSYRLQWKLLLSLVGARSFVNQSPLCVKPAVFVRDGGYIRMYYLSLLFLGSVLGWKLEVVDLSDLSSLSTLSILPELSCLSRRPKISRALILLNIRGFVIGLDTLWSTEMINSTFSFKLV